MFINVNKVLVMKARDVVSCFMELRFLSKYLWFSSPYYFILCVTLAHHMPLAGAVTKALFFTCRSRGPGPGHVARPLHTRQGNCEDGREEFARVIVVSRGRHGKVVTERVSARRRASGAGARAGGAARLRGRARVRQALDTLAMKFSVESLSTGGSTQLRHHHHAQILYHLGLGSTKLIVPPQQHRYYHLQLTMT